MSNQIKKGIIIGAGPAGLTAASELLSRTKIKPILIERTNRYGGLSTTINYKGYMLDIGGHRFFTKSDRVMDWWLKELPIENSPEDLRLNYHSKEYKVKVKKRPSLKTSKDVMLVRNRKSRIYYNGELYDYPLKLSLKALKQLGIIRTALIFLTYSKSIVFPIKPERNLEDFFINRFGSELYKTFFRTYTEKVWGVSCKEISSEWGAQRVKGLSVGKAVLASLLGNSKETSLIEKFLYPKYGPGQLWNKVGKEIIAKSGEVIFNTSVRKVLVKNGLIKSMIVVNEKGHEKKLSGEYYFSSMAIKELVGLIDPAPPGKITDIANNLQYRGIIVVGLLINKIGLKNEKKIDDNWIYIHDERVKVGRIQIFNNWSPYLIRDKKKVWIGMEYFSNEGDSFWNKTDKEILEIAKKEIEIIGLAKKSDCVDGVVVKMPKAYPAYTGSYKNFPKLRKYLESIDNLFLIGRNGMHKYNNQDHSMLTAMVAVDNIIKGRKDKANIWEVNTEEEYHERK